MSIEQNDIRNRQKYYWQGKKYEEENNLAAAIESYKIYSTHLAVEDKHIPHQWIAEYYDLLGDRESSLSHLEEYAKGCTPAKSAELFKEIGEKFLEIKALDKALVNFERAIKANPAIALRKKIDDLKIMMR